MHSHPLLYWSVSFIIAFLITWGILSIIVQWMNPSFYDAEGNVNIGTTAWVAAVMIVFTWIVLFLVYYIIQWWMAPCDAPCAAVIPEVELGCPTKFRGL